MYIDVELHPLTKEIKDYFVKNVENEFVTDLKKFIKVQEIIVSAEHEFDGEVLIVFDSSHISSLSFSGPTLWNHNDRATVRCEVEGNCFDIPFYYTKSKKIPKSKRAALLDGSMYGDYENTGREKLFKDILAFFENVSLGKVSFEYIDKAFKKSRLILKPNIQIAKTKAWNDKLINNKKLNMIQL